MLQYYAGLSNSLMPTFSQTHAKITAKRIKIEKKRRKKMWKNKNYIFGQKIIGFYYRQI